MRHTILYTILILLTVTLSRCETEAVDVKVPEFNQKLVITGFLSPSDTVSYINVTSNWGIYGLVDTELPVGILSGSISDGVKEVALDTFRKGLKFDHRKMKIEYGKTYTVKITSDKGLSAEASCKVPGKKAFLIEADTFSLKAPPGWSPGERHTGIRVSFDDIPGEENYYRLSVFIRGYNRYYQPEWHSQEMPVEEGLISDRKLDGKKLVRETGLDYVNYFDSIRLIIYLYHTEKSYYQYHKSIMYYDNMEGPFSEPTPVYSNVKNGLGIFTSYTVDSAVFRLK